MTKNYAIVNGSWTSEGNYSGYNAKGERIHIYKRQMESVGFKVGDSVGNIFAIAKPKDFSRVDDQGVEIPGSQFTRLTALNVFKTEKDLAGAHIADAKLNLSVKQALKSMATEGGLSDEEMSELLAVAL